MTADAGELTLAARNATIEDLVPVLRGQQARKVDVVAPAPAIRERVVAAVSASRSTWTLWNLRAEAERQIRSALPILPPERHRAVADAVTALAVWGAVVRRLFDAEGDGWEPARLLATVALRRELASADSVAEVLAWRIDAFLADNPGPPQPAGTSPGSVLPDGGPVLVPSYPAYESAAGARGRLTALAVTTLGGQLGGRAQDEAAWPALIAALRRAENAGYSPADALTRVATARELRTARSVSEVLAWRINRHLAAHAADTDSLTITPNEITTAADAQDPAQDGQVTAAGSLATPLLPWVPGPRQVPEDGQAAPLSAYLSDAATLITTRIQALADTAVRLRHPWTRALGQPPDDLAAPANGSTTWPWSLPTATSTRSLRTIPVRSSAPTPSPATSATMPTGTLPNQSSPPASSPDSSPRTASQQTTGHARRSRTTSTAASQMKNVPLSPLSSLAARAARGSATPRCLTSTPPPNLPTRRTWSACSPGGDTSLTAATSCQDSVLPSAVSPAKPSSHAVADQNSARPGARSLSPGHAPAAGHSSRFRPRRPCQPPTGFPSASPSRGPGFRG
jgi:hypothetical protein